jgi:hypothetical protein
MSASDFSRLPPWVIALILVMFWPVIWGGALFMIALAGDLVRLGQPKEAPSPAPHEGF